MHELSLASGVVETAVKHADGLPVRVVRLKVGALRQVVPESLAFYFDFVARGTLCEGARLEQELVAARFRCPACDREWRPEGPAFRCPDCGSAADVVAGEELLIVSIDIEEGEPCTASG